MFPLCVRRRVGRYAVPDPQDKKTRAVWVLLARFAGWTLAEIATDWRISQTRARQIYMQALRSENRLVAQLREVSA